MTASPKKKAPLAKCRYCDKAFTGKTQEDAQERWYAHVLDAHQEAPPDPEDAALQPVVDLMEEFNVEDFGWAGVRLTRGMTENA